MNHSKKHTIQLLLLITSTVLLAACGSSPANTEGAVANTEGAVAKADSKVATNKTSAATQIGAFIRTTGPDAYAAKALEQGMQIAIDNKAVKANSPVSLSFQDSDSGKAAGSAALKSFVEKDSMPAVIYLNTEDIQSNAPYFTQADAVGLIAFGVTKEVANLGSHVYGFGYSTEGSFKELAKYAGKTLKSYRFGIISSSSVPYDRQSKAFIEESKSLGNTIVFDEKVESDSAGFAALLEKAKKENCDTIFATLPGATLVSFIKAARASTFKGKLIVGDSLFAPEIASLGKDAEGLYMTQAWSDDSSFKAQYSGKFGSTPDNVTLGLAAVGYDLINCLQDVGTPLDADAITYSFLSKACEGLTGKTGFSGERIAQRKKRVVTVKDGQLVLAQ